jgi:hypothetical protein
VANPALSAVLVTEVVVNGRFERYGLLGRVRAAR